MTNYMKMYKVFAAAAAIISLVACNKQSAQQMADAADKVKVSCNPEVLTKVGGEIPVTLTITYPESYFTPQSKLVVTTVQVYAGGEVPAKPFTYQGEMVKENNRIVSDKGGTVTESFSFPYSSDLQKCYLELRGKAYYRGNVVTVPSRKVAEGVITTGADASRKGYYDYKADGYQHVVSQTYEGQIHYDVNSAAVKNSELSGKSFQDFKNQMKEVSEDDRVKIKDVKIISYASPEGGEEHNAKLSDDRSNAARQTWSKALKDVDGVGTPDVKSVGQDWEGFKEAVAKSDLEDKDLILRVLSMYNDPGVRENEIRNMSQIFTELKKEVLPELRRSRFVTEIEVQNYTDEELHKLVERKRLFLIDEPALLRIAATSSSLDDKAMFYRAAADRFGSQIGKYDLAITNLDKDAHAVTEVYLDQLEDQNDPDVLNARGVVELRRGNLEKAAEFFRKSGNESAGRNLGVIALLSGDYKAAAEALKGAKDENEAIADIMAGDLNAAREALEGNDSAMADYYRAVIAARNKKVSEARKHLESACKKDPSLKEKSLKDIEFVTL